MLFKEVGLLSFKNFDLLINFHFLLVVSSFLL
jgi:hypothetical protein